MKASEAWSDWSCLVRVTIDDQAQLPRAVRHVRRLMGDVEIAASRFRLDSEVVTCNRRAGRVTAVSPMFRELVETALDAGRWTDGAVDPTVGTHLEAAGYDRDIDLIRQRSDSARLLRRKPRRLPNWSAVRVNHDLNLVGVPRGLALDLGSTAKAWTVDRAARDLRAMVGGRVLVEIGGDVAAAGADDEPFAIKVAERAGQPGEIVDLGQGGLATSTVVARRWRHAGQEAHHIIDPATGMPARSLWRTATVWASTALAANAASTAAIVLNDRALPWLAKNASTFRLVDADGYVRYGDGWPVRKQAA